MRKQKIIAIFIICLLILLVFNINICNAQENIEVGVKKRTEVSFSSTEQNIKWEIEDPSIAEIVSTGEASMSIGGYFRATYSATIEGLKEGTTKIKVYNKNGILIAETPLEVIKIITDLTNCNVSEIKMQEYLGKEIQPDITITEEDGTELVKNIDYDITYKNNIDVGTATATITGKGIYSGTITKKFEIVSKTYFTNSNFKIQKIKVNENEQDFLVGFDIGKTKVEDVISDLNIVAGYKVQAFKNNKKLQNNEKIGTGTVIKVYDTQGKEVKNYIALVYGDVNGDGNISSMDGLAIIKHRTNKVKIQDSILLHAARVTENTRKKEIEPTSTDALAIVKAKLGKYTITNEQYYKGFEMKGTIKIPRTGIEYPILANAGKNEIEVAVGIMYPRDAQLNTKGNITITGHNYRDDTFFSNNKNIELGDKIYITDETGKTLEYVVYNKYETTPQDSDYITRDTQDNTEITLTTVTDDAFQRLIIYAKAN